MQTERQEQNRGRTEPGESTGTMVHIPYEIKSPGNVCSFWEDCLATCAAKCSNIRASR